MIVGSDYMQRTKLAILFSDDNADEHVRCRAKPKPEAEGAPRSDSAAKRAGRAGRPSGARRRGAGGRSRRALSDHERDHEAAVARECGPGPGVLGPACTSSWRPSASRPRLTMSGRLTPPTTPPKSVASQGPGRSEHV
jgi:hypothetical protein